MSVRWDILLLLASMLLARCGGVTEDASSHHDGQHPSDTARVHARAECHDELLRYLSAGDDEWGEVVREECPLVRMARVLRDAAHGTSTQENFLESLITSPESLVELECLARDVVPRDHLLEAFPPSGPWNTALELLIANGAAHEEAFIDTVFALMRVADGELAEGLSYRWGQFLVLNPDFLQVYISQLTRDNAPGMASLCGGLEEEARIKLITHFTSLERTAEVRAVLDWLDCPEDALKGSEAQESS